MEYIQSAHTVFTVKNWAADIKPCKVMSAGCTTWNISNRHTQYLQLKTGLHNMEYIQWAHTVFTVKNRAAQHGIYTMGTHSIYS